MEIDVGARLKTVRKIFGLSQRELAKRAGVTNGTISLIEQNRVSPSISSLRKVLSGFPMSMGKFFTTDFIRWDKVFYTRDDLTDMGSGDVRYMLVAAQRRQRAMAIMSETYGPGADSGEEMLIHEGEEGGVIVSGELEVTVGGNTELLKAGDAYYFDSSLPHRFRNPGDTDCELITANTPPTF
jgi:transcriptional regulator with XRE-family HTH domain